MYSPKEKLKQQKSTHLTAGAVFFIVGLRIFQQFGGIAKHVAFSTDPMVMVVVAVVLVVFHVTFRCSK